MTVIDYFKNCLSPSIVSVKVKIEFKKMQLDFALGWISRVKMLLATFVN